MNLHDIKKILFLDEKLPVREEGIGYPRVEAILNTFCELGHSVTFFPMHLSKNDPSIVSRFPGIEVIDRVYGSFEEFAKTNRTFYDAVFISRPHNFRMSHKFLKKHFKKSLLIYDAEAVFYIREELRCKVKGLKSNSRRIDRLKKSEFGLLRKADFIFTVSNLEKDIVSSACGDIPVRVLSHCLRPGSRKKNSKTGKDCVFWAVFRFPSRPMRTLCFIF